MDQDSDSISKTEKTGENTLQNQPQNINLETSLKEGMMTKNNTKSEKNVGNGSTKSETQFESKEVQQSDLNGEKNQKYMENQAKNSTKIGAVETQEIQTQFENTEVKERIHNFFLLFLAHKIFYPQSIIIFPLLIIGEGERERER